jgi:hypothetical protein
MDQEIISIVAVPTDKHEAFFSLSNLLGESLFYLDKNHLPHITIAQFKAPYSSLDRLQEELKS